MPTVLHMPETNDNYRHDDRPWTKKPVSRRVEGRHLPPHAVQYTLSHGWSLLSFYDPLHAQTIQYRGTVAFFVFGWFHRPKDILSG